MKMRMKAKKFLIKTGKRRGKKFCTSNDAILSMQRKKHKQKKTWQMCQKEISYNAFEVCIENVISFQFQQRPLYMQN
jgi:hypothetical protein